MTITVTDVVAGPFVGTGSPVALPFTWKTFTPEEIEVVTLAGDVETIIAPNLYTVTINKDAFNVVQEGGSVLYTGGVGAQIYLRAKPAATQDQTWSDVGSRLRNMNEALDRAALRNLRAAYDIERGVGVGIGSAALAVAAKNAALVAQAAAEGAAGDANDYKVQTGLDRIQTGLDRIATGQDRADALAAAASADADAVQTALDRLATDADRVAAEQSAAAASGYSTSAAASAEASDTSADAAEAARAAAVVAKNQVDVALADFYQPETVTLLAAFTVRPTRTRMTLIDDVITGLKNAGLWTKMAAIYFTAAHDLQAARVNWKAPGGVAMSVVGTVPFVADVGFTGGGGANGVNYLDVGVDWTALSQFTRNSCHIGAYAKVDPGSPSFDTLVADTDATDRIRLGIAPANGASNDRLNSSANNLNILAGTLDDHFVVSRTSSTSLTGYRGGVLSATTTDTSQAIGAGRPTFLGGSGAQATGLLQIGHLGAGLTDGDVAALYKILDDYLNRLAGSDLAELAAEISVRATTDMENVTAAPYLSLKKWRIAPLVNALGTAASNDAIIAAALAAGADKVLDLGRDPIPVTALINLAGLAGVENMHLDYSTRPTFGGLVRLEGTQGTKVLLSASQGPGSLKVTVTNPADVSAISAGDLIYVGSLAKRFQNGESMTKQMVRVDAVSGGTVYLKDPIRQSLLTTDSAYLRVLNAPRAFRGENISIVGKGNVDMADATTLADRGLIINHAYDVELGWVRSENCSRNGQAIYNARKVRFYNGSCLHDWTLGATGNTTQIMYGLAWGDCLEDMIVEGYSCEGGRHGAAHTNSDTEGYAYDVTLRDIVVKSTYDNAVSEHDGAEKVTYDNVRIVGCASGLSIRGMDRVITNLNVSLGFNDLGGDAIVFSENPGKVDLSHFKIDNARFAVRMETSGLADNQALMGLTMTDGEISRSTNGIYLLHKGGANEVSGGYNTTVCGPVRIEGVNIYASAPSQTFYTAPYYPGKAAGSISATSVNLIRIEGYFSSVVVTDCDLVVDPALSRTYAALILGATDVSFTGNRMRHTQGLLWEAAVVIDATGATVSRGVTTLNIDRNKAWDHDPAFGILNTTQTSTTTNVSYGQANHIFGREVLTLSASGQIRPTNAWHRLETYTGAASDNLELILGGWPGQTCALSTNNNARDVTVPLNGAGGVYVGDPTQRQLTHMADRLTMTCMGSDIWAELSFANNF